MPRFSPLLLALAGLDIASERTPYRIIDAPDPIRFDPQGTEQLNRRGRLPPGESR